MSQPKDKDWLNGYKNKTLYMLSTRDPPQNRGHIQTESEGLEKDFPLPSPKGIILIINNLKHEWVE